MVSVSGNLHGKASVTSIQNHDRRTIRNLKRLLCIRWQATGTVQALQHSVLSRLLAGRATTQPILGSWARGLLHRTAETQDIQSLVQCCAEALQGRLMPVLLYNVLTAWWSVWESGVACLQLPVRYAITSSSTMLDCMFLVPLIPREDGEPGAAGLAKLAALQLFHNWLVKSWDRILCWYDQLCVWEGQPASAAGLGKPLDDNRRKQLQEDRDQHCVQAEAFQLELPVAMAAAEALLGEADMLGVVVGCEELPHHFNSARRLPDDSQEGKYVAARIHRHSSLASRRHRLKALSSANKHSTHTLKDSIKSRLMFATVRRVLQMDVLGCCPAGLEIIAFSGIIKSARHCSKDSIIHCNISPPKSMLLPLLDELFCSYDSFRAELWPVEDPVLAYMSRKMQYPWNSSNDNPVRRATDSRIALPGFVYAIQHVMIATTLRQLRPSMLHNWTLHVSSAEEPQQAQQGSTQPQPQVKTEDPHKGSPHGSSTQTSTQEARKDATAAPETHPDTLPRTPHNAAKNVEAGAQGAAVPAAPSHPITIAHKLEALAQHMPALARTEGPCSDAVLASRNEYRQLRAAGLCSTAAATEHLQEPCTVVVPKPQQAPPVATSGSSPADSEDAGGHCTATVLQIWGASALGRAHAQAQTKQSSPHQNPDPDADAAQGLNLNSPRRDSPRRESARASKSGSCLWSMPPRRASQDFMAVVRVAEHLPHHSSGLLPQAAASRAHNAVWERTLALPAAAPMRVWEHMLSQPASVLGRMLRAQGRWETAQSLQVLSRSQEALEKLARTRSSGGVVVGSTLEGVVEGAPPTEHPPGTQHAPELAPEHAAENAPENAPEHAAEHAAGDAVRAGPEACVWQDLARSSTDADGQRVVRRAWAAAVGLAKLAKAAQATPTPQSQTTWQKKSPAFQSLQLAVQDMSARERRSVEPPKWGDHRAVRVALHKAQARLCEIKGWPAPLDGPLGPFATPEWLSSAASSSQGGPATVGAPSKAATGLSAYRLPSLQAAVEASLGASQTPEWLQARIAHTWSRLGVMTADPAAVPRPGVAGGGLAGGSPPASGASREAGVDPGSAWGALLPPPGVHEQHAASPQRSDTETGVVPGPLRHYEFDEEVLFALDSLVSGALDRVPARHAEPVECMGAHVWDALLNDAVLMARAINHAWGACIVHASEQGVHGQPPPQQYAYLSRLPVERGSSRRSADVLKVWAAWQDGAGAGAARGGAPGGVRGSRFDVVRDSMDQQAPVRTVDFGSKESGRFQERRWSSASPRDARDGGHGMVTRDDERRWRRHSNQVAAAAGRRLRARAAVFKYRWRTWNDSWLAAEGKVPVDTSEGADAAAQIDVFSFVPEDSAAAIERVAEERQSVAAKVAQGSLLGDLRNTTNDGTPAEHGTLSLSSMLSSSKTPHEQLRVFAELLLMHADLCRGLSEEAWFPADNFCVQFQQHKSGKFVFRKPSSGSPSEWPSLQVSSMQPVLTCLGVVLFGLSPGLTLSNKPSAHSHNVTVAQRARHLLRGAAVLCAVPAIAALAWGRQNASEQHAATSASPGGGPSPHPRGAEFTSIASQNTTAVLEPAAMGPDSYKQDLSQRILETAAALKPDGARSSESTGGKDQGAGAGAARQAAAAVSVRQQVAMAKDMMLQLRDSVWHGLESSKSELAVQVHPAVFHVCVSAEGAVLDIAPLSRQARRLLPKLPISDSIFSANSASKLRAWRASHCNPSSKKFDPTATAPFIPRRRQVKVPANSVLLEVTVYPDATQPQPLGGGFLGDLLKPVRGLTARLRGAHAEASPPEDHSRAAAASTVVAVPVDRQAASLVRAAFDSAGQEYGPCSIFNLQTEGLENCEECSSVVSRLLRTGLMDPLVDAAVARLEVQLQQYNELCSLRGHDSDAPVGREQLLTEICRTCTARYHMVLQQARRPDLQGADGVVAEDRSDTGAPVAPVVFGADWWDRVQQLLPC